ncbi:hypothetical protein ACERNI_01915 [Camelimonas sp. ID_303_24]
MSARPAVKHVGFGGFAALAAPGASARAEPSSNAPLVGGAMVHARDAPPVTELIGRVEAINAVDILSRASGFVRASFQGRRSGREGQELYRIEPDAGEIALSEAEAALAARLDACEARVRQARLNLS